MPGCTLVEKCPTRCLLWRTVPYLHLSSPTARCTYYTTVPKPKQAKAGQNELTSCLQQIQPLSGGTTHAALEPKQVRADWIV